MDSYDFTILHENVASSDAFEDKTHEKAAHNIYRAIKSSCQAATIGLEGGWGSGKSTVVNLLKRELDSDKHATLTYLFDAWAHDGDPLRRIFLEGLIDQIDTDAQNNQLQNIRSEISGNKKTVDVKTKKSASRLGGLLSFSAIFVPLGAALLSAIDYKTVSSLSLSREIHWPFFSGLLLTLAPLWTLYFWRLFSDDHYENSKGKILGKKEWDVFESSAEESYTQDIKDDGERTSIEFERYFSQIMDLVVGEKKQFNQALIVVDNLDRVEPEKALSIWSILQTFFQHRSHESTNTWRDKLWFLIPCSGLMTPDASLRDNTSRSLRCHYESETYAQAVP